MADAVVDGGEFEVLPRFDHPPVVEVVLGYEFQPIANFGAMQLAQLAMVWQDRYPTIDEQPPLPMSPPIGAPGSFPQVFVNVGAPAIRLWLHGPDDTQLLQVQRDRLILNWRHASDDPYPHYDTLRPEFVRALGELNEFLADRSMGPMTASAVEVSYVNEVIVADEPPNLAEILRSVTATDHHLGAPAASRLLEVRNARSLTDMPATLTLTADTEGRAPNSMLITLTYRGALPMGASQEDVMATMDLGHRDVVIGFAEATTDEMHNEWGRRS